MVSCPNSHRIWSLMRSLATVKTGWRSGFPDPSRVGCYVHQSLHQDPCDYYILLVSYVSKCFLLLHVVSRRLLDSRHAALREVVARSDLQGVEGTDDRGRVSVLRPADRYVAVGLFGFV